MDAINVAIVGAGARAIAMCKFIADNPRIAKLVSLVDLNSDKANLLNNHFNFTAKITNNMDAICEPIVDAVLIATPDYAHVAPALTAMKANKNVYLEKPLATTLEDCRTIINAASTSRSICYLGFNLRHSPVHEKIYSLIRADKLGKITTIEANELYYGGKTYFRRWNRLRKFGGGLWLTKSCHDFDLITWISGGNPVSIYAKSRLSHYKPLDDAGPRCRDCKIKQTCPDYYDINKADKDWYQELWRQLQLKMEQNGALAPDICLYNSEKDTFDNGIAIINYDNGVLATYTVNVLSARSTRQMRVIGTDGMIEGDMESGILTIIKRHSGKSKTIDLSQEISDLHGGADEKILSDFFSICRKGGTPRSGLTDGKLAVQLSLAATKSDDENSPVFL
ncbi:MAG: Gfo/Idh/MocA family protein [Sedimentisphaerales bacterium]